MLKKTNVSAFFQTLFLSTCFSPSFPSSENLVFRMKIYKQEDLEKLFSKSQRCFETVSWFSVLKSQCLQKTTHKYLISFKSGSISSAFLGRDKVEVFVV